MQKHFFKVGELSGSSDWGQESPICFLKSVKSQRILSSDIFVFWALHAFEKLTAFIERIRCVVMFEFYNKGQGYCCLHGNSVFGYIQKGVLIGIQLFQNGVSCSGTETTITMGYKKRTKYALK